MIEKSPDKVFKTLPEDLFMLLFVEKMAGNKMAFFDLFQLRSLALTFLGSVFAAACESDSPVRS